MSDAGSKPIHDFINEAKTRCSGKPKRKLELIFKSSATLITEYKVGSFAAIS